MMLGAILTLQIRAYSEKRTLNEKQFPEIKAVNYKMIRIGTCLDMSQNTVSVSLTFADEKPINIEWDSIDELRNFIMELNNLLHTYQKHLSK
jgi:hypothetical protein